MSLDSLILDDITVILFVLVVMSALMLLVSDKDQSGWLR